MNGSEEATETAQHVMGLSIGVGLGALGGLAAGLLIILVVARAAKTSPVQKALLRKTWLPALVTAVFLGLWLGVTLTKPDEPPTWFAETQHVLLLLVIGSASWLAYANLGLLSDPAVLLDVSTGRDIRRFKTQAQILKRFARVAIVLIGVVLALLTFPSARAPMASVLASAGVLSIVVGMAAQSSLGNMFAGLQLAFTDALRVGDTVMIDTEDQPSLIEEITLTYVVLRTWDERRILLPSNYFTTQPFENWTRRAAKQLAWTIMELDWSAPIAEIRAEVGRLVEANHLWDGRSWSVQVVNVNAPYLELKVVVSAASWSDAWDLRSYLRENMVAWINDHAPQAVPKERILGSGKTYLEPVLKPEQVDESALAAPEYQGKPGGGATPTTSLAFTDPDKAEVDDLTEDVRKKKSEPKWPGKRLFGGSPDGDKRAKMFDGPGEDVIKNREKRAKEQAKLSKEGDQS